MPQECSLCTHPKRTEIDRALAAGEPLRSIADRFGTSKSTLIRHRMNHLAAAMEAAKLAEQQAAVTTALDIRSEIRGLVVKAREILEGEESKGDGRLSLMAIREIRATLELLARLEGQLDSRAQVNILMHPDFAKIRVLLVGSVGPCPECRARVAEGLRALEAGDG